MSSTVQQLPEPIRRQRQLEPQERFSFACHSSLPCFNRCCADVTIMLTPVDVVRLARRLGMRTDEFLDRHTLTPVAKDVQLPVVVLRMNDDEAKRCPFVGEHGCTVYEDRPWACRMYPVGMAVPPARAGVDPEPVFVLFEDDFCFGRGEQRSWTVAEWREDQQLEERDRLLDGFRGIVSHPWFIGGVRQLDPRQIHAFYTACFDLDTFRELILESSFLQRFDIEPDVVERIRHDDDELLRFAYRWLRYALFAEPTITVRPGAPAKGRQE
jgi:Fe-S-cluster containining protein